MSAELRLIIAPGDTYARLARGRSAIGPIGALRRPLLIALVLGASVALAATRHVTPGLLLSTTLCWSFVVVVISCDCACCANAVELNARPTMTITPGNNLRLCDFIIFLLSTIPVYEYMNSAYRQYKTFVQ